MAKKEEVAVIGEKIEMGQVFDDQGRRLVVTRLWLKTDKPLFKPGDEVIVTGISKGKGFTGVMKRWGFKGGPRTRGQSDRQRAPGSIGQTTSPGRVWKGKKMAGRAGGRKVTVKGLKVVSFDQKTKILSVSGPIPGTKKGSVEIKKMESK